MQRGVAAAHSASLAQRLGCATWVGLAGSTGLFPAPASTGRHKCSTHASPACQHCSSLSHEEALPEPASCSRGGTGSAAWPPSPVSPGPPSVKRLAVGLRARRLCSRGDCRVGARTPVARRGSTDPHVGQRARGQTHPEDPQRVAHEPAADTRYQTHAPMQRGYRYTPDAGRRQLLESTVAMSTVSGSAAPRRAEQVEAVEPAHRAHERPDSRVANRGVHSDRSKLSWR